jgi:hypothetical protein
MAGVDGPIVFRPVAPVLVAALVVVTGCGGVVAPATPTPSTTPTATPSRPSPPAAAPDRLTASRAVARAKRLERTRTDATACGARFDRWVAGGYYVVADCPGAVPAVYRVEAAGARRLPLDEPRSRRAYRGPAGTPTLAPARDVAVVHLADAPVDLSVGLRYAGPVEVAGAAAAVAPNATRSGDGPTVVAADLAAEPNDSVRLQGVVARPGRYLVVVRTGDGRVARATWTVVADSRADLVVYVDPSGRLTVRAVAL